MRDALGVLHPRMGLVSEAYAQPPVPNRRLLWSVGGMLADAPASGVRSEAAFRMDLVGACGPRRDEALIRAAGEVVERWAVLVPDGGDVAATGSDAGPSGAAAGPSEHFCRDRGLRELVERDAAMRAWYLVTGVRRLEGADIVPALGDMGPVMGTVLDGGSSVSFLQLPSRCRGLGVVMCLIIDEDREIVACGLGCAVTHAEAVIIAARESCQMLDLYTTMRTSTGRPHAPSAVHGDLDRAAWWGAPGNLAAIRWWLRRVDHAPCPGRTGGDRPTSDHAGAESPASWEDLLAESRYRSLTTCLPGQVRQLGWHAGRVDHPTLTPLIMDETSDRARVLRNRSPHSLPHPII